MITTTVTFSGGYTRGPWLASTLVRHTVTGERYWTIQRYWTNGAGSARYEKPLPGYRFKTKREAEEARKNIDPRDYQAPQTREATTP